MKNNNGLSINIRGVLHSFSTPWIMGILNVTEDSFYARSRTLESEDLGARVRAFREEGADCIDIGACSTRPGATPVSASVEKQRLVDAVELTRNEWPEAIISVDTFRAEVARAAVEAGADIINDISGGARDPLMFQTVADLRVPYILMHSRGDSVSMQEMTDYADVAADVLTQLAFRVRGLRELGVCDIIIDPGFGFAKTVEQNYELMANLSEFTKMGLPLLVGISRKSMIWRPLGLTPEDTLPGTVALNAFALMHGANILRVHDVAAAVQTRQIISLLTTR